MRKPEIATQQLDIFTLIEEVSRKQEAIAASPAIKGKATIDATVRSIISESLKTTTLSRYEVAAKMSEILGVEITKSQLDSWSAESKDQHRFPLVYVGAFCCATGNKMMARYVAQVCEGYFIEGEDAVRLEFGRLQEKKAEIQKQEKLIKNFLNEIGRRSPWA